MRRRRSRPLPATVRFQNSWQVELWQLELRTSTLSSAVRRRRRVQGEAMFTPHSLTIALCMMITSAICWGSWANTYKGVKNYRFELFYWDYAIGIFLVSLILALTIGNTSSSDPNSFLNNVHSADAS